MPTIDVDYFELERLLGVQLNEDMKKLDEIFAFVKGEVKAFDKKEGFVSIEMKDTARADLWSVEGLSRALQGFLNQTKGLKQYTVGKSAIEINVNAKLYDIRPYICCSVIKDIHLSDNIIKGAKADFLQFRSLRERVVVFYQIPGSYSPMPGLHQVPLFVPCSL